MKIKGHVRKDFDPAKEYSVDVADCTEDQKKAVQQAFFDVGIVWVGGGAEYQHLDKVQYTNTTGCGHVTEDCMFGADTEDCNMTAKEFLDLVYEPEKKGHVHAELMAQYAEDAKTHPEPWLLWQMKTTSSVWINCECSLAWATHLEYRRKPKTHIVNGVEIPDLRVTPEFGEYYYLADPTESGFTNSYVFHGDGLDSLWSNRGLCYQNTEEGKQAAIQHAKAMLGMAQE